MQITIDVPDIFLKEISLGFAEREREIKFLLASKLVESGRISSGKAAEWIGISKPRFLQEMGRYGMSIFPVDGKSIAGDVINATNVGIGMNVLTVGAHYDDVELGAENRRPICRGI